MSQMKRFAAQVMCDLGSDCIDDEVLEYGQLMIDTGDVESCDCCNDPIPGRPARGLRLCNECRYEHDLRR